VLEDTQSRRYSADTFSCLAMPNSLQLLLVLWKTMLACCGGVRELERVKKLSRELSGLPPVAEAEGVS
jgi:hypothetical protein